MANWLWYLTFILIFLLTLKLLQKLLEVVLPECRANWKNEEGKRMKGARLCLSPTKYLSHFRNPVLLGKPLSSQFGDVYFLWHGFEPFVVLANWKAVKSFYSDHFSHKRDPDMSCLGYLFEGVLGTCTAVIWGRENVKNIRRAFDHFFSMEKLMQIKETIVDVCETWIEKLPPNERVDLSDCGLNRIHFVTVSTLVYGSDVLEKNEDKLFEWCQVQKLIWQKNSVTCHCLSLLQIPSY